MDASNNVSDFLLAGKPPATLALRLVQTDHTYGELRCTAAQVAHHLLLLDAKRGDRIILISDNSLFWVAAYLGALQAGLVCVPLPTTVSPQNLDYIRQTTEPRIAFVQARFAMKNGSSLSGLHLVTDCDDPPVPELASHRSFANLCRTVVRAEPSFPPVSRDDLAALMFTSGSTGSPRGVMVTHDNIVANTESIIQSLALTANDRMMAVLPFHYCFGTSLLHTHLRVGASLVVDLRFMYPETILQRMIDTQCTGFAGVPSHFQILLRNSNLRSKQFPHLRYVQQAGGSLAPSFIRELRESLPRTQVFVMYGQTEATARLSCLPPEFLDSKPGSVGKGIPGVKLQVLKDHGTEVLPGDVGEIVAEGRNVAKGYWRASDESAAVFRDGKLYTGDLATVDSDGFIYVVDRARDFVKCGGKRVSCRQIEEQLLEFEGLLEAAVIGVPDDVLGEALKAFVVPRASQGNNLIDQLFLFCKHRLPSQLVPKEIVALQTLPKNSAGKTLKANLKAL